MQPNPFLSLLKSRKFWLLVLNIVVSATSYFVTKYVAPAAAKDVLYIIGLMQPAFVFVIGAIAYEDGANAKAGASVQVAEEQAKADIKVAEENTKCFTIEVDAQ